MSESTRAECVDTDWSDRTGFVLDRQNFRLPHLVIYSARLVIESQIFYSHQPPINLNFCRQEKKERKRNSLTLNVLLLSWSDLIIFLVDICLFNNTKINFNNLIYCKIEEDVTTML